MLSTLYSELQDTTGLPVDIAGIQLIGRVNSPGMFAGKPLTWLRDTTDAGVQTAWGAFYRDLIILDPLNHKLTTYSLNPGVDDLSVAANYAKVKNYLAAAATLSDSDGDHLPDYWEQWAFGSLSRNAGSLMPDGRSVLQHYAHGSPAPLAGALPGLPRIFALSDGLGGTLLSVNWRGRRGTALGLTLVPEFSATLATWGPTATYEEYSRRPLYDGTGAEVIEWRSVAPNPIHYIRIRATTGP